MQEDKKSDIIKSFTEIEFQPETYNPNTKLQECQKFPLSEILALGPAFKPLVTAIQEIVPKGATEPLYKAVFPKGAHLAMRKDGSGYIGGLLSNKTNQVVGQATFVPVNGAANKVSLLNCNPYMIVTATALMSINKKLDLIQQTQQEILAFLEQKEKANLVGNLNFLSDIINNYKFNWNNDQYKNSNHIKVLDIKHESEKSIALFKSRVESVFENKNIFTMNKDIKDKTNKLLSFLGDYQLSVYNFSFSSFIEVLLLENFDESYLNKITEKINNYALEYREVYSDCSEKIEKFSKDSVSSFLLRGISASSKFLGETFAKIPVISDSQIDENLIETSDKIKNTNIQRNKSFAQQLTVRKSVDISPFIENLLMINKLYNEPIEVLVDENNMYMPL